MMYLLRRLYHWVRLFPKLLFLKEGDNRYLKVVKKTMDKYDMVTAPSEDYFKLRYMTIIDTVLKDNFDGKEKLKVLDAGCGQGRLTIELAKKGHKIDAIDCTESALQKARNYAAEAGIKDCVNWIKGDLSNILSDFKESSYDIVLCMEVLYMMPRSEECFRALSKMVKPEGILLISVRLRLFYLIYYLMHNDFLRLDWCAKNNNMTGLGGSLSWFDPEEVTQLFLKNGFENIEKWGIGILSGIKDDPTSGFSIPCFLSEKERILLGRIEDQYSQIYVNSGRYMVFSGKRQKHQAR